MDAGLKPVLLGGIPRSGTTLTCHLLNQLPDTLALVEPLDMQVLLACESEQERADFICRYAEEIRACVSEGKPFMATALPGEATNTFEDRAGAAGRKANIVRQPIVIDRNLAEGFRLIIKHPNAFIALLPELAVKFRVFVQIREPLAVLASWQTLDHTLRRGRAPMAENLDPSLRALLDAAADDLDRQLVLLDWYFSRITGHLERDAVLRYEDIVESGGKCLQVMAPGTGMAGENLKPRNDSPLYDRAFIAEASRRLADRPGAWESFYGPGGRDMG